MSAEKDNNLPEEEIQDVNAETTETESPVTEEPTEADSVKVEADPVGKAEAELAEMKDKYLRLYSEFDNYKRRTSKERLDLLKTANQEMVVALLPVVDDFERARNAMQNAQEVNSVKEGVELIFNKLASILQQKGLKPMETINTEFDADKHEAITEIPAPTPALKGKVVDEVTKGYYLHDKVIRFAKVVIGA